MKEFEIKTGNENECTNCSDINVVAKFENEWGDKKLGYRPYYLCQDCLDRKNKGMLL